MFANSKSILRSRTGCCLAWVAIGLIGCQGDSKPKVQTSVDVNIDAKPRQPSIARLPFEFEAPAAPRASQPGDWFEDVTAATGIRFQYQTGCSARHYTLLETIGGGVALLDFDCDGDLDVFFAGGGSLAGPPVTVAGVRSALYRNDGNWRFSDVTESMGLAATDLYTHGATVGDYDRDGYPDLLVTGYGGCHLYRNDAGQRFVDAPFHQGLAVPRWFTSAAFGDFDRDGWPDLFVCCYADWKRTDDECVYHQMEGMRRDACAPTRYPGQQSVLWRNQGDGTFCDVSDAAGILPGMRSLGVVTADLDGDGWLDWFVANDVNENQLYWGGDQLPLQEGGIVAGVAYSEAGERDGSMGTDVADFDGDGILDLFIANFAGQDNVLARGAGARSFANVTRASGLGAPSRRWVKFASLFADFNLDGWPDLFISNGHVLYDAPELPYAQPAQLFQNQQGKQFREVTSSAGPYFSIPHAGRGAAAGDLDNDGAPDLIVVHQDQPVTVLRNQHPATHWVRVSLRGKASGIDPVGARVLLQRDGITMTSLFSGGGSYLSHSDRRALFVTTSDEPIEVTVVWPGGAREVFTGLTTRMTHELVEGSGRQP